MAAPTGIQPVALSRASVSSPALLPVLPDSKFVGGAYDLTLHNTGCAAGVRPSAFSMRINSSAVTGSSWKRHPMTRPENVIGNPLFGAFPVRLLRRCGISGVSLSPHATTCMLFSPAAAPGGCAETSSFEPCRWFRPAGMTS
jgi:hypothetical protein